MIYRIFEIFSIFYFYFIMILNVQLDRTTIFENIFDTIQFFMRRKFWTINNTKLVTWDRDVDMILKRRSRRDICMIVQINCFVKRNYICRTLRVMILNYFRINCIIERLYSSCYWLIFRYVLAVRFWSLYDFIFWLYFLSMSMFSDCCMKFSETFFFFLALTFSKSKDLCCVRDLLRSSLFESTVSVLLFDSLLWDSRNVSSYQFSLNWNDNLSCNFERDVCLQSLIHACMLFFVLDVRWNISLVCSTFMINICFEMSFIKVLNQKLSVLTSLFLWFYSIFNTFVLTSRCLHRDARSEVVCMSDALFITLFDLQYMRIDFEMFFIKVLDQKLFVLTFSFYFARRTVKVSVSLCQCECDLSEVANFCLTIAHEIYDSERISSTRISMILSSCLLYFRFLICFCSVTHWSDSRIRALSILLSFNNERISSTRCQWFYRRMHTFLNMLSCSSRWSSEKSMHYSVLLFFTHRRSCLMHNREQKRDHLERLVSRC